MRMSSLLMSCILLGYSVRCAAQDANYWTPGYNPGGFLTPGAVIACNRDSGVLFYNPALLAYIRRNSASISGDVYQLTSTKINNAVGKGLGLSSTSENIIPEMAAGVFAMHGRHPFVIGYALIRNPVSSFQATQRKDAHQNVLNDSYSPGAENYIGQYATHNFITETNGLLSVGFKLNDGWSAGFSVEGQFRSQSLEEDYSSRAIYNSSDTVVFPPIANSQQNYLVTYIHAGIRFKGGLSYNRDRHHLGLLVSSPLLHLYGRGTLFADDVVNDIKDNGLDFNFLANTRQTGLKARWKVPLSIGLGYAYDYSEEGQIYAAAEYFNKVGDYNIVTPRNEYFIRPDTGNVNEITSSLLKLRDAHKAVVNFALGASFVLKPGVLGYFSFRTDFNYADKSLYDPNRDGIRPNLGVWDNYHLQTGINVKKRKFNLRPGVLLSYGSSGKYRQAVNFDNANDTNLLLGEQQDVKAHRLAIGILFAYIHNL